MFVNASLTFQTSFSSYSTLLAFYANLFCHWAFFLHFSSVGRSERRKERKISTTVAIVYVRLGRHVLNLIVEWYMILDSFLFIFIFFPFFHSLKLLFAISSLFPFLLISASCWTRKMKWNEVLFSLFWMLCGIWICPDIKAEYV